MNIEQVLKYINEIDLSPQQIEKLRSLSRSQNINRENALKIMEDVGLDVEEIQKKIGQKRAEEVKNRVKKVGVNELCPCQSGKKYKKCCKLS